MDFIAVDFVKERDLNNDFSVTLPSGLLRKMLFLTI